MTPLPDLPVECVVTENGDIYWMIQKINQNNNDIYYGFKEPSYFRCNLCGFEEKFGGVIDEDSIFSPKEKYIKPEFCPGCKRKTSFKMVTPHPMDDFWPRIPLNGFSTKLDKVLPLNAISINEECPNMLSDTIAILKECIVLKKEIEYLILALWVIASWRAYDFYVAPYLCFMGEIESGKTRGLELIRELSYHCINVSDVTEAAIPRLLDTLKCTLCLDDAGWLSKESERAQMLLTIFKAGYKKDTKYVSCDKDDQNRIINRDVYGFKAFSSTETFDPALMSRSIVFWMEEAEPPCKDIRFKKAEFERLRGQLFLFKYFLGGLPELPESIKLIGRIREIFEPILRVALFFGVDIESILKYARFQHKNQKEKLFDSFEAQILMVIYEKHHMPLEITRLMLKDVADGFDMKPHQIGRRIKNMNITTVHSRQGQYISFEDQDTIKKLEYLYKKYGTADMIDLDHPSEYKPLEDYVNS